MIEIFVATFLAISFFALALGVKVLFGYRKRMLTSSCHQSDGNQNCECFSQEEEKKKSLRKNVLKRAKALLAS